MMIVWSPPGTAVAHHPLPETSRELEVLCEAIPRSGLFPAVASRWLIGTGRGDLHVSESGDVIAVTSRFSCAAFLWRDYPLHRLQAWLTARGRAAETWFVPGPGAQGLKARPGTREFACLEWRQTTMPWERSHELLAVSVHDTERLSRLQAPWLWEYFGSPEALLAEVEAYGAWDGDELISVAVCAMRAGRYADVSVATAPHRRRTGAALDACACLLEQLSSREFVPVWNTAADHTASIGLARRLGFVPVGTYVGLSGLADEATPTRQPAEAQDVDPRKE